MRKRFFGNKLHGFFCRSLVTFVAKKKERKFFFRFLFSFDDGPYHIFTNEFKRRVGIETMLMQLSSSLLFCLFAVDIFQTGQAFVPSVMSNSNPKKAVLRQSSSALSGAGSEYGASSTSFYTTVEKKDQYESLEYILNKHCSDPKVREVITDMLDVCAEITEALRSALVTVEGSMNDFGDAQLSVDVSNNDVVAG